MNAVQIFTFALCIYQISAGAYEDTLATCKKESGLKDDKPIDSFFVNAAWPADTKAPCYFNCLGKNLNIVDANGVPNKSKLVEAASQHKDVPELQVLSIDSSITTCTPQATGPSACAATENYVICAIKNAPKQ